VDGLAAVGGGAREVTRLEWGKSVRDWVLNVRHRTEETDTDHLCFRVDQKYSQLRAFDDWGQVVHEADPEPAGKSWARTPEKASELEVEVEADPLAVEVVVPHDDESDEEDDDHEPADSVLAESQADDDAVEAEPHESEEDPDSVADDVLDLEVVLGLE
jgi:hypothetical protein